MLVEKKYKKATTAFLLLLWGISTLNIAWLPLITFFDNTPNQKTPVSSTYNYLIISTERLKNYAENWSEYRASTGYKVRTVLLKEGATEENVREAILNTYAESGRPYPFYVLIIGHAHPNSNVPEAYIPTAHFQIAPKYKGLLQSEFVSGDNGFIANTEDFSFLPIAIGRIPVGAWILKLSDPEFYPFNHNMFERIESYEKNPPTGKQLNQFEFIASDSLWGDTFGTMIEKAMLSFSEANMPNYVNPYIIYGYGKSKYSLEIDQYPASIAERMSKGSLWFSYVGHGGDILGPATSKTGEVAPMFSAWDVITKYDLSKTILTFVACTTTEIDREGNVPGLSESLYTFMGGPVAVFGSSKITFATPNTFLQKDLMFTMYNEQPKTIGIWLLQSLFGYSNPKNDRSISMFTFHRLIEPIYSLTIKEEPNQNNVKISNQIIYFWHAYTYILLGDPAMRLAPPVKSLDISIIEHKGNLIKYKITGNFSENAKIITTIRRKLNSSTTNTGNQNNINEAVNDLVVAETNNQAINSKVFDGEIVMPSNMPSGEYILQSYVVEKNISYSGAMLVYHDTLNLSVIKSPYFLWAILTIAILRRHGKYLFRKEGDRL